MISLQKNILKNPVSLVISKGVSKLKNIINAGYIFWERRGGTLAAASTFYLMLSIIPFSLLFIRLMGFFVGDFDSVMNQLHELILHSLPQMPESFFLTLKEMIRKAIYANKGITFFNFLLLIVTLTSFLNSLWNGLFIITDDKSLLSWKKHLTSILLILSTFIFFSFLNFIPLFLKLITYLLTHNTLMDLLHVYFPSGYQFIFSLNGIGNFSGEYLFLPILLGLFTYLYWWFFNRKLDLKSAFWGGASFVILLFIGKKLFLVYMGTVRLGVVRNYGDYYTLFLGAMWAYFSMCFFYFGASLCYSLKLQKNLVK